MNKNMAIGIAVFCIIAVIGIASTVSVLNSKDSTIATQKEAITSMNSQISSLNNQVNSTNSQNSNLQNKISLDNSTMNNLNSEIANLTSQVSNLQTQISNLQSQNSSTSAQNSALESQISSLNSQLNTLNSKYNTLNSTYNTLSAQYVDLQDELVGELGIQNGTYLAYLDDVAITNYSYTSGLAGMTVQYNGIIDVYNFGSSCTVSVEVYGANGVSATFTLNMPVGYEEFVETWNSGLYQYYYSNITILSVQR